MDGALKAHAHPGGHVMKRRLHLLAMVLCMLELAACQRWRPRPPPPIQDYSAGQETIGWKTTSFHA